MSYYAKATLVTRCGCKREMVVELPPKQTIVVPLRSESVLERNEGAILSPQSPAVRRFELQSWSHGRDYDTAVYLEEYVR